MKSRLHVPARIDAPCPPTPEDGPEESGEVMRAGDAEAFPAPASGVNISDAPRTESLPQVLTADELARLLRINRKTVYVGFRAGEIPGGKRIGGTIRFSRDAVLKWLAEGQVPRSSRGSR